MTQRGTQRARRPRRTEGSPARRAEGAPARRPQLARRVAAGKARLRRGPGGQGAAAARVLGMSTTRRAAVLAIVVCALAFTVAVPLRTYLAQRAEVAEQEQRQAELKHDVALLEQRKAAVSDPAQVEAEARRRLRYVMPGETPYVVQLPEDAPKPQEAAKPDPVVSGGAAWYQQLWSTVGG
ncbi:FtsB family cell division protein [Amycolatopsis granulosa]|uniref:FtsB family cell division protein n=1 Tax=Amycolatopsis granulosa TaxID=185684 RepID=UPI0014246F4B|nr:septum formation initiator family protein [Amycolatopsis granulosa]NIH87199.1 cell division protein FtsB [Amycolatopsis granulosa]